MTQIRKMRSVLYSDPSQGILLSGTYTISVNTEDSQYNLTFHSDSGEEIFSEQFSTIEKLLAKTEEVLPSVEVMNAIEKFRNLRPVWNELVPKNIGGIVGLEHSENINEFQSDTYKPSQYCLATNEGAVVINDEVRIVDFFLYLSGFNQVTDEVTFTLELITNKTEDEIHLVGSLTDIFIQLKNFEPYHIIKNS